MGRRGNQYRRAAQLGVQSLTLVGLIASCGDPSSTTSATVPSIESIAPVASGLPITASAPVPTDVLPGTTLVVMPTRDDGLVASIEPMFVTEPCPDSPGGPEGTAATQAELARLEPMLGVVVAYGGQHPDEFGSYGLIWQGTNDASVFISFTTRLDAHRDALRDLVTHPDELIVCQVAVSGSVAQALMARLSDELQGHFSSVGVGVNGVEVLLNPGEQALAAQLLAEYGDAVRVSVCEDADGCVFTPL